MRISYVDRSMRGGEESPGDFDLEDLPQGRLSDIAVVPVTNSTIRRKGLNAQPNLVSEAILKEAHSEF